MTHTLESKYNGKKINKGKGAVFVLYSLLFLIIAFFLYILCTSKGETTPIEGQNSIATIKTFEINGIKQYIAIRGVDKHKPVLLYLHGGPGFPEVALAKPYSTFLEAHFVVVHWEQRGAGKTYALNGGAGLSAEQLILDTKELSMLLAKAFEQDKIYLLGHSWGTFLGMLTIQQYPKLFHAYMGIGQACDQYQSEALSLQWIQSKNSKIKMRLPSKDALLSEWVSYMNKKSAYVIKYSGSIYHEKSALKQLFQLLLATEYTLFEKIAFFKGLASSRILWLDVINANLSETIKKVEVPIYIFQGKHDYQTVTSVAKAFFEQLEAPTKKFYLFENSAHSPHFEEMEKFNQIVLDEIVRT